MIGAAIGFILGLLGGATFVSVLANRELRIAYDLQRRAIVRSIRAEQEFNRACTRLREATKIGVN